MHLCVEARLGHQELACDRGTHGGEEQKQGAASAGGGGGRRERLFLAAALLLLLASGALALPVDVVVSSLSQCLPLCFGGKTRMRGEQDECFVGGGGGG